MPFVAFHVLCPDVASRETRITNVLPDSKLAVPAGDYHFIEMFCDEPACACRRVFFSVFSPTQQQFLAVIAWGWEDRAYYMRWIGINNPRMASEMQGPILNLASPQSEYAGAVLGMARNIVLIDPLYVETIRRHYALFRSMIREPVKKSKRARRRSSRTRAQ